MKRIFILTIGIALILGGGFVLSAQADSQLFNPRQPKPAIAPDVATKPSSAVTYKVAERPVSLYVPKLNLFLEIDEGFYSPVSKAWNLSNTRAQWATITPRANNKEGNTFIYAHNYPAVFGRLSELAEGDEFILLGEGGHTFVYTMSSRYETNPYDDRLFYYTGPPILTVQTCSGVWDQNRLLVSFKLTRVEK